jgi:hypothetical protein
MRTFERAVVTDFFKRQSWRCKAALATLRNRMGDDWVDMFLLHHFEAVFLNNSKLESTIKSYHEKCAAKSCVGILKIEQFNALIESFERQQFRQEKEFKDWQANYKTEKFGWIDTMLINLILQVLGKYLLQWAIDYFTIDTNE